MINILVTGGAGFIGANFIAAALKEKPDWHIINLDALTYAGNRVSNKGSESSSRYEFIKGNICDTDLINRLFTQYRFKGVFHFAAESHVDRSIQAPDVFVKTNINGTFNLLDAALKYVGNEDGFRFIHVSTDEVFGSLSEDDPPFTETSRIDPSSPYSASKASSDMMARSFFKTFGLPVIVSNCSNNFGPFQFPEKLIPLVILNVLHDRPIPVYGTGENIRDWLFVKDHCEALIRLYDRGRPGQSYNIGGGTEMANIRIIELICRLLDKKTGRRKSSQELVAFVKDRKGHDFRYSIDSSKIRQELYWEPRFSFSEALDYTIDWYLQNPDWLGTIGNHNLKGHR